ncbi:hypothetical protein BCR34DRAFT_651039 [Clohesyomyces aquaticus]|uniref:Uncharacterized protein n=1 Tax=Clohesyomyces aquaticus TaxID=1231657 RepID=A0A1Y1ZRC2_9PLEO|nr:hypothetical protein BCR34DRAFT_651039 [Clohesyomyces aquaticus]
MPTWGRGGAGNIVTEAQVQAQTKRVAEDLEAQRSLTSSAAPPATSATSNPQDYAHSGRGGAGNWYQPSELAAHGSFVSPDDSTSLPTTDRPAVSTPWHPETQEMPVARAGRGGAGNFVWKGEEEKERERRVEEERRRGVEERVERVVEEGLAKPGAVVLGGVKAGRGW